MTSIPARILISLFLCSALTSIGVAQQPSIEDLNTPAVRVTTRLVLVDTVVTDKSGQRIRDLKQEDFTVLENGKPQKISAFSFESPAVAPRQALELPPNVHTNRPEYDMPKGPL